MVLGTPCETVLLPVNVTGPFIKGFVLSSFPVRNAISQNSTTRASKAGNAIHLLRDGTRFFGGVAIRCSGSAFNLNSCQSLNPRTDTSAWSVDGCGVWS